MNMRSKTIFYRYGSGENTQQEKGVSYFLFHTTLDSINHKSIQDEYQLLPHQLLNQPLCMLLLLVYFGTVMTFRS